MAQSRCAEGQPRCPLLGVMRTSQALRAIASSRSTTTTATAPRRRQVFPARERPPAGGWGRRRLEAAHSVPPEIRTCADGQSKLTQSSRPFWTSSDYPFGLLRGRHHVIAPTSPRRTGSRQRTPETDVTSSPRHGATPLAGRTGHRYPVFYCKHIRPPQLSASGRNL
jgi:hypothetical protein